MTDGSAIELDQKYDWTLDFQELPDCDPRRFNTFLAGLDRKNSGQSALHDKITSNSVLAKCLISVMATSHYLAELIERNPYRLCQILDNTPVETINLLITELRNFSAENETMLMQQLRIAKQKAALTIALADLVGFWKVADVTHALTRLADACLKKSIEFLLLDALRAGKISIDDPSDPTKGCGYFALAMGKHGAHELNYSSDIDLIILYDPDAGCVADPMEASSFFVRMTKRLVKIMQDRTADGYVFRTDLRLRPDPGATPAAMSVPAALQYYESMGQNWERAALIKARPCAGDLKAGALFLKEIIPFIWRKYFDYAAIADVHSIKRQIHAHKGHAEIAIEGHNVKLGRGGIREIEFFVQTQQLIAGGRDPGLRLRGTIPALKALAKRGWITDAIRDSMSDSYEFLRSLEHRIQMVRDEQTHLLPEDKQPLADIAVMMGFTSIDKFTEAMHDVLSQVQKHYAALFEEAPDLGSEQGNLVFTGEQDDPETLESLHLLGYQRPTEVTKAIRAWHFGRYPATRSTRARERLTELTPVLLKALSGTDNPDQAFIAFNEFLSRLPAGVQMFSLLRTNPHLLHLLALILGTAPRLASIITRRPHALDALLDPAFFGLLPEKEAVHERLQLIMDEALAYEDALDRARIFGQEQTFLVGARMLAGSVSAVQAGRSFARIADVLVNGLLEKSKAEIQLQNGNMAGGRVAVVALGKLGGHEMTAGSDLDLMLIYTFKDTSPQSDGKRSLAGSQYYARLTQRLITALSVPTGQGTLYDVDFRLRPSGNSGPVATHLDGFRSYHEKEAWTWEHMALTRARIISGDSEFCLILEDEIRKILCAERDPIALRRDVANMRTRIAGDKGTSNCWDLKQIAGGFVDVEFIVQSLQLEHAFKYPECLDVNTTFALKKLGKLRLISSHDAAILVSAIEYYTSLSQVIRVCIDGVFDTDRTLPGLKNILATAVSEPDFNRTELVLKEYQKAVREVFLRLIGPLEADG